MLDAPGADALLHHLAELGHGDMAGLTVGPLQTLLPEAGRCHIDGLPDWPAPQAEPFVSGSAAAALMWDEAATRALTAERAAAISTSHDDHGLLQQLSRSRNPYEQIELLATLWRRAGPDRDTGPAGTVREFTQAIHDRACHTRRWSVMRRGAGLLDIHDDRLEDAVADIVASGKRIALGRAYSADSVVAQALGNSELQARLARHGGDDPRGRVLIEEIVLLLGLLIKSEPRLFDGMLTLRPWQAVLLLTGWLAREHGVSQAEALTHLLELSPHAILGRLREVITREQELAANLVRLQALHGNVGGQALVEISFGARTDPQHTPEQGGWPGWREMTGVIARVPDDFHARVWELLQHCAGLVIGDQLVSSNRLDSRLARADSTAGERGFALQVDELISRIQAPDYRQLTIEALVALSEITRANPALKIEEPLVLDVLIGIAVRLGWQRTAGTGAYNEQVAQAWTAFYTLAPHQVANMIMAAVAYLLSASADETDEESGKDSVDVIHSLNLSVPPYASEQLQPQPDLAIEEMKA
jgi:phosphorylase kinase alpha/beta subunit